MKKMLLVSFLSSFFSIFASNAQNIKAQIEEILSELSEKYDLVLHYESVPESTWGANVTARTASSPEDYKNLLQYLKLFKVEWEKYSPTYVQKTNVKEIAFVTELAYAGQVRGAIPDSYKEILYYDFMTGNYNPTYQRHVVHHEYYHMIEEQINGSQYYKDPRWAAFNESSFSYGQGGAYARGSDQYGITHPRKGFINLYSISGLEEDKAEIYAMLFVEEEYKLVAPWIDEDDILKKKVRYMKAFIDTLETI
jgi:hypothetical protein